MYAIRSYYPVQITVGLHGPAGGTDDQGFSARQGHGSQFFQGTGTEKDPGRHIETELHIFLPAESLFQKLARYASYNFV